MSTVWGIQRATVRAIARVNTIYTIQYNATTRIRHIPSGQQYATHTDRIYPTYTHPSAHL